MAKIRGLMFDPARLCERHDFYFDLLPRLAAWGYNTIWWHFCDDEGFMLQLDRHPELATPFAFSKAEMRNLIERAAAHGIDIVPEVESLGHTRAITSRPEYAHLFNGNPWGHNAICPSHPDTMPLITDLLEEVADLFPSRFLHAGLDEAVFDSCPRCVEAAGDQPLWSLYAAHVQRVHGIVAGLGKRMIMWADGVERHPELLAQLPKDIVLTHWHYSEVPEAPYRASLAAGFEIIGSPAISGEAVLPSGDRFDNVDTMHRLLGTLPDGCLGQVTCWWESARILRDTIGFAASYAANPMPDDRTGAAASFLKTTFGIASTEVAEAFWQCHRLAPLTAHFNSCFPDTLVDLVRAVEFGRAPDADTRTLEALVAASRVLASEAVQDQAAWRAYVVAATLVAATATHACGLRRLFDSYAQAAAMADGNHPRERIAEVLDGCCALLDDMQKRAAELTVMVDAEWDRTRHPDDLKKTNRSPLVRQRAIRHFHVRLQQSQRFLERLAALARQQLATWREGGPFPDLLGS